ncbi:MAG TPA: AMP-binding protein [Acidimicrobiia bacterium]|nr:AMP-binding protein [Acidimicrobiia bacterium]
MRIGELIRRAGATYGAAPALVDERRTMSFAEFDEATDRLGNALLASGFEPGDRVAVLLPNSVESVVAYYGLVKAGLVRIPLNARETAAEHAHKLADSQARGLIHGGEAPGEAERLIGPDELEALLRRGSPAPCRVELGLDDPYRLAYSGGTTGKPKGVVLTTRTELAEVTNFLLDLLPDIRPGDVMLHAAPVTHGSGAFVLPHLVRGATSVIMGKFDAGTFLETAERTGATATFLVPTMIAMLLEEPDAASAKLALRRLCYGGAPIAPAVLDRALDAFGPVLVQTYGQAEAPLCITLLRPEDHTGTRAGSAGRPYTLVEVGVVGDDGEPVATGETGEVVTRGQHVMAGYWRNPDATAAAIRPDGWLRTGDMGRLDEAGFLHLVDRRNDLIISGGFNVYPREVEDTLKSHPAVVEAVAVGLPDEKWGERVAAAVIARTPVTPEDLDAFCAERMAGYKRPRHLEVWDDIPLSPVGKVLRRAARDRMLGKV